MSKELSGLRAIKRSFFLIPQESKDDKLFPVTKPAFLLL